MHKPINANAYLPKMAEWITDLFEPKEEQIVTIRQQLLKRGVQLTYCSLAMLLTSVVYLIARVIGLVQSSAQASDAKHKLDILALIHSASLVLISLYVFKTTRSRNMQQQYFISEYNKVIVICVGASFLFLASFLFCVKVTFDKANEFGLFLMVHYLVEAVEQIGFNNLMFNLAINLVLIALLCALNIISAMA